MIVDGVRVHVQGACCFAEGSLCWVRSRCVNPPPSQRHLAVVDALAGQFVDHLVGVFVEEQTGVVVTDDDLQFAERRSLLGGGVFAAI